MDIFKKIFSKTRLSNKQELDFVYDQAVILAVQFEGIEDFGTKEQQKIIEDLEEEFATLLPAMSGIDGDEFGDNECIVYIYGPSADSIFKSIEPALRKSPFNHIDITLQYGRPDNPSTKDKTFTL